MNVEDITTGEDIFTLLTPEHLQFLKQNYFLQTLFTKLKKLKERAVFGICKCDTFPSLKITCRLLITHSTLINNKLLCHISVCYISLSIFTHSRLVSCRKRPRTSSDNTSSKDSAVLRRKWLQIMMCRSKQKTVMCCCTFNPFCKLKQCICCTELELCIVSLKVIALCSLFIHPLA